MAGKWRKKLKWRGGVFWGIPIYLYKVPKSQGIGQLYSPRPPYRAITRVPHWQPPPRYPLIGLLPRYPTRAPYLGTPLSGYYPGTPLEPPIWVPPPYTIPPTPYHWQTLYMTCSPHQSKSKKARISIFHSIVRKLKCNKM